jgi:7-keto-8-aminopelargonate synthetase-like enzyme
MDGDVAPIADLCTVCHRYNALLILDEAHAVIGPEVEKMYLEGVNILRVGTLSKTLASMGGFVAGKKEFIDLLVNRARPFIFSTALTPAATAAALAALEVVCSAQGKALCTRLQTLVERLKPGHLSPIIPIILGEEERALAASSHLLDRGFLVPAIRPPTVPPGTSRLRISLSAGHTDAQVEGITSALSDLLQC